MVKQLTVVFLGLVALLLIMVITGAMADRYYSSKAFSKRRELIKQEAFASGVTLEEYIRAFQLEDSGLFDDILDQSAGTADGLAGAAVPAASLPQPLIQDGTAASETAQAPAISHGLTGQAPLIPPPDTHDAAPQPPLARGQMILPMPDLEITPADMASMSGKAALIHTSVGSIVVELYLEQSPRSVKNFMYLARNGFYNGLYFTRHSPGTFLQAGSPNGRRGGTAGYWFDVEPTDAYPFMGTLSFLPVVDTPMISSEFYILLKDGEEYKGNGTVFGRIIDRFNVAEKIADSRADGDAYMFDRVYIRGVEIVNVEDVRPEVDFWATNFR